MANTAYIDPVYSVPELCVSCLFMCVCRVLMYVQGADVCVCRVLMCVCVHSAEVCVHGADVCVHGTDVCVCARC